MTTLYFAADGSWGNAEGILVVDARRWSSEDFERVSSCADSDRLEIAKSINSDLSSVDDALPLEYDV